MYNNTPFGGEQAGTFPNMPAVQPGPPIQAGPPTQPGRRIAPWQAILAIVLSVAIVVELIVFALMTGFPQSLLSRTSPVAVATPTVRPTQAQTLKAVFHTAACPFKVGAGIVEGQTLICGYVTVPENRAVHNGRTVRLAVATFKATPGKADPDPVLRLDGGPGGPSLASFAVYVTGATYKLFVYDHDLIMFDQRGTGYSQPSLNCPELIKLQYATISQHLSRPESERMQVQAARACHDRLVQSGIDLNAYTTQQNAADVQDIIHALGYKQMTLYGVSYGTRLALTVMHLYPAVVHASVLDSVYPPQENRTGLVASSTRSFNVLFQGCAANPTCNSHYPGLKSVFYKLVNDLNAHPISFQTTNTTSGVSYTASFAGDDLVFWLFSALYATSLIPQLPAAIFGIRNHDYTLLSQIYGEVEFDDTFSYGLFYSVTCGEDWAFLTQQDIPTAVQQAVPEAQPAYANELQQEYDICQLWNVKQVPRDQKQAVSSNLPTLVLSGEYDPITPPDNGKLTAQTLPHSYYFLFPGQGHGEELSSQCSDSIISDFEDNPNQQPPGGCISGMTEPAFA